MSETNKAIIEKVNAAFLKGGTEEFLSFCTEDIQWTMLGDRTVKGKDAILNWMAPMKTMEPPKFTVKNVIAEGDFVVACGDMTMKDTEGKIVPYSYCDVYRFRGDKIAELTSYVIKTEAKSDAISAS
jgi:uncharacterized protein